MGVAVGVDEVSMAVGGVGESRVGSVDRGVADGVGAGNRVVIWIMSPGVQAKRMKSRSKSQYGESVTRFFIVKIPDKIAQEETAVSSNRFCGCGWGWRGTPRHPKNPF